MSNANVNFPGQVNLAGATDATFLKLYAGEVAAIFETKSKFIDKHKVRTIQNGKSASFPITGDNTASYHVPGTELLGTNVPQAERVIDIDALLVSHVFTSEIEEAKNHYDFRGTLSSKCANALVKAYDKNIAQLGVLAARSAGFVTGQPGGSVLTNAAFATDATVLVKGLFDAAQILNEKDVPEDGRYFFCKPATYNLLMQNLNIINNDFKGAGSISEGQILKVAGLTIVMTNNLPDDNITTGPVKYQGNFTTTVGLVMTDEAVGTVKLFDIATEMERDVRRQGTLIVAKYAMGHGILRPECAVELRTGAPV